MGSAGCCPPAAALVGFSPCVPRGLRLPGFRVPGFRTHSAVRVGFRGWVQGFEACGLGPWISGFRFQSFVVLGLRVLLASFLL